MAHLLFHRPLELTGNYPDKLESPTSAKMQCDSKATNQENFPMGCLADEDMKGNQQFSHQGLENSCSVFEAQPENQFRKRHCLDTSENASNNELADAKDQVLDSNEEKGVAGFGG